MLFHATKTPLEERLRSVPPAQSPTASAVPREKGVDTIPQPGTDHGCCSSYHSPQAASPGRIYINTHSTALLDGGLAQAAAEAVPNMGFPSLACPSNISCSSHGAKSFPSAQPCGRTPPVLLMWGRRSHPWLSVLPGNVTHEVQKTLKPSLTRASSGSACISKASGFGPEDGYLQISVFIPPATVL